MLHDDLVVTLVPGYDHVPKNLTKFRWNMNVALPYPFPARNCLCRDVTIAGKVFSFQIHNHYDRITYTRRDAKSGAPWVQSLLHDRRYPAPAAPQDCLSVIRESPPSIAWFDGQADYPSPNEAFAGVGETIKSCLDWLTTFLAACQRDAPYLVANQIYPISLFDIGTVYHEVRAWCTSHNEWHFHSSAIRADLGRQRQQPSFFMAAPASFDSTTPMDTANELLAEALMALSRGLPRLTVLNAYAAVESLANAVYSRARVAQLVANNVPNAYAEEVVEGERSPHRTDAKFLLNKGIKSAAGRSLCDENKALYEGMLSCQQLRHRVAHTGQKPASAEAKEVHKQCCEVAQWLADVGGYPVKPLLPDASASNDKFVAGILGGCFQLQPTSRTEQQAAVPPPAAKPDQS